MDVYVGSCYSFCDHSNKNRACDKPYHFIRAVIMKLKKFTTQKSKTSFSHNEASHLKMF